MSRLVAVGTIDALVDAPSSEKETKVIKFANTLSNALRANGERAVLAAAARALGRLAAARAASNADYVEFEVSRGLEVSGRGERRDGGGRGERHDGVATTARTDEAKRRGGFGFVVR